MALTDPVTAARIAQDTTAFIQQIRSCERLDDLKRLEKSYAEYAAAMGIVRPIKDHVFSAINETATLINARAKADRAVRDPTGERND